MTWTILAKDPKSRVSQSDTELCVMLDIPDAARKQIHGWVLEQEWPEGTDLHEPEKYHITLMYAPSGHQEHKDADWIEHLQKAKVRVVGIDVFTQDDEGRYPYVLRISSPEVKEHAVEMQRRAEDHGLEITHFPGGYKPHLTVGYGPEEKVGADEVVPLEFHAGPSFVSPPRKDKAPDSKESRAEPERESDYVWKLDAFDGDKITDRKLAVKAPEPPNLREASGKDRCGTCRMFDKGACWGYGNRRVDAHQVCDSYAPAQTREAADVTDQEATVLDDLSMKSVAHNLHYKFQQGTQDPAGIKSYAERLLRLVGYQPDEMNTMAALQSWQTMYPSDKALEGPQEPAQLPQAPPTTPTESWGYGTVSSWPGDTLYERPRTSEVATQPLLYHWTDVSDLDHWMDPSRTGPGYTYLTQDGDSPDQNPDVPIPEQPVRISIDPSKLDSGNFDQHYDGWQGNRLYLAPIPRDAIVQVKAFQRPQEDDWELGSTEPSEVNNPDDRIPEWGSDLGPNKLPHRDVQFSNDF